VVETRLILVESESVPTRQLGANVLIPERSSVGLRGPPGALYRRSNGSDEFGWGGIWRARLLELGRHHIGSSASELLAAITKEVVSFCSGRFQDDFTLVVVAAK
jgi:hypothetical protein